MLRGHLLLSHLGEGGMIWTSPPPSNSSNFSGSSVIRYLFLHHLYYNNHCRSSLVLQRCHYQSGCWHQLFCMAQGWVRLRGLGMGFVFGGVSGPIWIDWGVTFGSPLKYFRQYPLAESLMCCLLSSCVFKLGGPLLMLHRVVNAIGIWGCLVQLSALALAHWSIEMTYHNDTIITVDKHWTVVHKEIKVWWLVEADSMMGTSYQLQTMF